MLWQKQENSACQLSEAGVRDYYPAASLPATHTPFPNRKHSILIGNSQHDYTSK